MQMRILALALALSCALDGSLHAQGRKARGRKSTTASPAPAPSPKAPQPPTPEMLTRRADVRAAIDAWQLDRARALAAKPPARGQPRDPELTTLLGEIDILALKPADAARRLAPLAPTDRRAAWLANLCALATGDLKARSTLQSLAASTRPGEESLAELAWMLEGTLKGIGTTRPELLEDAARAALGARRKAEAALALFACRRMGEDAAQLQPLLDVLSRPVPSPAPK